jgi:hypothetical protein
LRWIESASGLSSCTAIGANRNPPPSGPKNWQETESRKKTSAKSIHADLSFLPALDKYVVLPLIPLTGFAHDRVM